MPAGSVIQAGLMLDERTVYDLTNNRRLPVISRRILFFWADSLRRMEQAGGSFL
jgi:hypothetical protein